MKSINGWRRRAVTIVVILATCGATSYVPAHTLERTSENGTVEVDLVEPWAGELRDVPEIASPDAELSLPELPVGEEPAGIEVDRAGEMVTPDVSDVDVTRREIVSERAADRRVFERSDGTKEVELYAGPRLFETGGGEWELIDTRVIPDESRTGGLRSVANSWMARFLPLAEEKGGVVVEQEGALVGMRPVGAAPSEPVTVQEEGSVVRYESVWPGVDLEYMVTPTGVKEDIVLSSAASGHRFEFAVDGARAEKDGAGLSLVTGSMSIAVPPPTVVDASGADVTDESRATYEVADGGTRIAAAVDQDWLASLPSASFPLRVDPTLVVDIDAINGGAQARNYSNSGGTFTSGDLVRIGRSSTGQVWRSRVHFNYEQYLEQQAGVKYRVVGARMALHRDISDQSTPGNGRATPYVATAASYAGAIGQSVDNGWGGPPTVNEAGFLVMDWAELPFESWLSRLFDGWFDADADGMWIGFAGNEITNSTMHTYWPTLSLYLVQPPPVTSLSSPVTGSVLPTRTPTLVATPVSGDAEVNYRFEISTARGGGAASVVSSGWTVDTTWTVPDMALQDGGTYYARVHTAYDVTNPDLPGTPRFTEPLPPNTASDREFRIDLKLGSGGPAPTESAGAVPGVTSTPAEGAPSPSTPGSAIKANLVNGNAAVSVPTHSVGTVGGAIAPALVYNSRGDSTAGLAGEYFADPNRARSFAGAGVAMQAQRVDKQIDFNWLNGSPPVESLPSGPFLARWTGFISVPTTGSWQIGVAITDWSIAADGGARVYLNNEPTPAANGWVSPTATAWELTHLSANRSLSAGARVPIRVELRGDVGQVSVRLVAKRNNTTYVVQPSWLWQSNPILPDGWQLSAAGTASWVGLTDLGDAVVVRTADGSGHGFRRLSHGGYQPPPGSSDHLTIDGQGKFALQTGNGLLYTFRRDGQLERVTSLIDDRTPAAPVYGYTGTSPRLTSITDPVSGRSVTFSYAPSGCSGPVGMLCRIGFWDDSESTLSYDTSGRLVRVTNAGYATPSSQIQPTLFDFGYDSSRRLTSVRDPLAADLIAYAVRPDDATVRTELAYDSGNRLVSIVKPAPQQGHPRPQATYVYDESLRTTDVELDGFTPSSGSARRVVYDEKGRITSNIDATGDLITEYEWDDNDRLTGQIDPAGLKTTYAYNPAGQRTDSWGPAPYADFGLDNRPLPGADVPHATTSYDDGFADLAAAYWSNEFLAGAPTLHGTGLPGTALNYAWSSPPITPGPGGRWSMRMTGEINFPAVGAYQLESVAIGEVRVWVDDTLVIDTWDGNTDDLGTVQAPTAGGSWHRLRVDYRNPIGGTPSLQLLWVGPSIPASQSVPDSALRPAYGLATTQADPDGLVVATEYTDPARHVGPEHGLATFTIADPNGLELTTQHRYEDPTLGGFLRPTNRSLPAGNLWVSSYYSGTEGPTAAVCGVASDTPQGGFIKQRTGPDPAGPDAARVEQFVYDTAGRPVGSRTGTTATIASAGWACTTYDGRGRVVSQTWPSHGTAPARTVNYIYAGNGDPQLTAVAESALPAPHKQVSSIVDLSGRLVAYSAGGFTSSYNYDQLGRVISSSGPVGAQTYIYEPNSARLDTVSLDGDLLADLTYATSTGRLISVAYGNSTTTTLGYDRHGRNDSVTTTGPSSTRIVADEVSFSTAGRVIDQLLDTGGPSLVDPHPAGDNFIYDAAGRLTTWHGPSGTETYGYGSPACGIFTTGHNTNRTSITRGSATSTYCYDIADRLIAGGSVTSVAYDDHGNTTQLDDQTYTYDSSGRLLTIATSAANTTYVRDALNRIVERTGSGGTSRPRYAGFGEAVAFAVNASNQITERYVTLPGGARLTIGSADTWSYANLHGDVVATADGAGVRTAGPAIYNPWGEGVPTDTDAGPADLGYLGAHGKHTNTTAGLDPTIDMGAATTV